MQTDWEGHYLDGRTAVRQRVVIHLMPDGLQVTPESGTAFRWPYAEIHQTQGFYAGEHVRLERGEEIPEVLVVADTTFLSALQQMTPQWRRHFHDPARRTLRRKLTVLAAVAVVGGTTALYLWGIPALVTLIVSHIPVSWEEHLGEAVVADLAPPERRCTDPTRTRALNEILTTVTSAVPSPPYTFRVIVVNDETVNALAVPGGYIVLFRGLLEQTRTAEELAGVLAHEVQHILRRHATHALLQDASTGLLVTFLTGDVSGTVAYGLEGARMLSLLQYSRRNEEEADIEGMRLLLAAGIDPAGMIAFFERLSKEGGDAPAFLKYVSTHPSTGERIETLKSLAARAPRGSGKLLPAYDWRDISKVCQAPSG
jgi:predicted Zn-dependent protease